MSFYYSAEKILLSALEGNISLRSAVFNETSLNRRLQLRIFALLSEAIRWSSVLSAVIENSGFLKSEPNITPVLAVLLIYDQLLSSAQCIRAPAQHPFCRAITRHKTRLHAEFTKLRIRQGFATVDAFRNSLPDRTEFTFRHPRWLRVNTIVYSMENLLDWLHKKNYTESPYLSDICFASPQSKLYHLDIHVPDLIAMPPKHSLTELTPYALGWLICQDKASCFPALLLNSCLQRSTLSHQSFTVLDACAAPGNKTTHLAALLTQWNPKSRIIALEKCPQRSRTLQNMLKRAHAAQFVTNLPATDFLSTQPSSSKFSLVNAILLDPSCSGSGILERDERPNVTLPVSLCRTPNKPAANQTIPPHSTHTQRLQTLASFQLRLLLHAMHFPSARLIVYSTCSVYTYENESVVYKALCTPEAKTRGWRILQRSEQPLYFQTWSHRGEPPNNSAPEISLLDSSTIPSNILDACIRCKKGGDDATIGFFTAILIRDICPSLYDTDEWSGLSD